MKGIRTFILPAVLSVMMLVSCKKEEQSCSDGIFSPEHEVGTDCGGVCPPCYSNDPVVQSYLAARIDSVDMSFSNYNLERNPDWVLTFINDSLTVSLNFGDGDSLGARGIKPVGSGAYKNGVSYNFIDGIVLFSEIDHAEDRLSGFFEAQLLSSVDVYDTMKITQGDFEKIKWQ